MLKHSLLLVSIILAACQPKDNQIDGRNSQLILDDGIYVEKFDSSVVDPDRYTANNRIFTTGRTFTYAYHYEDLSGRQFVFAENEGASELDFRERARAWHFIPLDSMAGHAISKIRLEVEYGLEPMVRNNPDYNQTVISYHYPQNDGHQNFSESTGLIENDMNIWMHPPRQKLFRILELNPFPFIMAPYEQGQSWSWKLTIGDFWGDERWKTWEGSITNEYRYTIIGKEMVSTGMGLLECLVISASAQSRIGNTKLISYFNPDFGFVKLDYTNIDSTKFVLELKQFEHSDSATNAEQ